MNGRTRGRLAPFALLVALTACAPRPPAGSVRHLDDEYGFNKTRFENPLSSFEGMEFVRNQKGLDCYRRRNDPLEVGQVRVGYIHYCFYGDRLASITVWAAGSDNADQLLHDMRSAYGKGQPLTARDGHGKQPVGEMWNGRQVTAILLFISREDYPQLDSSEVVLTLSSNRLLRDNQASAEKVDSGPPSRPRP